MRLFLIFIVIQSLSCKKNTNMNSANLSKEPISSKDSISGGPLYKITSIRLNERQDGSFKLSALVSPVGNKSVDCSARFYYDIAVPADNPVVISAEIPPTVPHKLPHTFELKVSKEEIRPAKLISWQKEENMIQLDCKLTQ